MWSTGVRTFGEPFGVAVDLQGVQSTDLEFDVIVQELLHHRLERQQQLLLLVLLLLTGCCKLLFIVIRVGLISNVLQEAGTQGQLIYCVILQEQNVLFGVNTDFKAAVPGHKDVDKAFVCVEFSRDVVLDPLVDGLCGGIYLNLFQQLLFQFHQREQKAQTFSLQNLEHPVLVLVTFYMNIKKHISWLTSITLSLKLTESNCYVAVPGSIFCMLTLLSWNRSVSQSRSLSLTICCRQSRKRGKCAPFSRWWAKSARLTKSATMACAANWAR